VDLETALAALESSLAPDVAASLRKPATAAALKKLGKVVGELGDLETWFSWHDGQAGHLSIAPSTNERLLTSAEAAEAYTFLRDEGVAATLIPVMGNGAGDYVLLDRKSGRLTWYRHDDDERTRYATSLVTAVRALTKAWTEASRSTKREMPDGWTAVKPPTERVLAKKPAGTAYCFRSEVPALGRGVFFTLVWKQAPRTWFTATLTTLEGCWTSISNNLFPFRAMPDRGAAHCLDTDAEVFEQHFAKPPLPASGHKSR
jgi:hypothetical protein